MINTRYIYPLLKI